MKIYYIDRKTPIKQFDDLSLLEGRHPVTSLTLHIPAGENFVLQLAAVLQHLLGLVIKISADEHFGLL